MAARGALPGVGFESPALTVHDALGHNDQLPGPGSRGLQDRGIAQSGSAPALGAGCRGFESLYPDQSHITSDWTPFRSGRP